MTFLEHLRECLATLQDYELQKKLWFALPGESHSDFAEMVCQTFDDTGLSDFLEAGTLETKVGKDATAALLQLDEAVGLVDESLPREILIDDPAMETVRVWARQALEVLPV